MENKIDTFEKKYEVLVDYKKKIYTTMEVLDQLQIKLNKLHSSISKDAEDEIQILALDSLQFQIKNIHNDVNDARRVYNHIINRIYGDYYKSYEHISAFYVSKVGANETGLVDKFSLDAFPIYKDLEPFKPYDFSHISKIHTNIVALFRLYLNVIKTKESELEVFVEKQKKGLSINNFVNMKNYNTIILREKLHVFIEHIEYIDTQHLKYLSRLHKRTNLILYHANNDIDIKQLREPEVLDQDVKNFKIEQEESEENITKSVNELIKEQTTQPKV